MESGDERALIRQLYRREPAALTAAYDRYAKSVYSLVLRITRDQKMSEDLVHELFVRLCDRSNQIDLMGGSLHSWLLSTARKMAIDHVRPLDSTHLGVPSETMADVFRTMESREREVLELSYFHGSSQEEIAALLGLPLEAVKSWIHSALLHVRRHMNATA
jgi:RNA polymerase sigma-70 factor (ECF subfamily)